MGPGDPNVRASEVFLEGWYPVGGAAIRALSRSLGSGWCAPCSSRPGAAGCVSGARLVAERPVDVEQGLLLALGDRGVVADRRLQVRFARFVEDPGAHVERLGRDAQPLGDALEDLRRRLAQPALD